MKKWAVRAMLLCLCVLLLPCFLPPVSARAQEKTEMAKEISGSELIHDECKQFYRRGLFDDITVHSVVLKADTSFTLKSETGIGSLYFIFGEVFGPFTITDLETGTEHTFGEEGFLHTFADLEKAFGRVPEAVRLHFPGKDAKINEIHAFTAGQVPEFVQKWEMPAEGGTDLVLFSTHGDDEQIFFAGMLPWYAGELDYEVQVVYLTDHYNNSRKRVHEMLDGLWTVGVKNYPVFGSYGDYYSDSLEKAVKKYKAYGVTEEELLGFVVEQLRRFRPKVAVGHDLKGEYGHGMHMLYADLLCKAVEISNNPDAYPDLAEQYGTWDVPKTYLHLYPQNTIHMNWDIPLDAFDGMTAYEVTRDLGFPCHVTQRSAYAWYFRDSPTAESVDEYSCCDFGLYRTTVGADTEKQDFFENVTTYARDAADEAALLAAEEARQKALEQERIAAEEAARQEAARKEAEATAETQPPETVMENPENEEDNAKNLGFLAPILLGMIILGAAWMYAAAGAKKKK